MSMDGDTVTVFDAARAAAIAIGTKASLATRGPDNAHLTAEELHEVYVTVMLDALLAARSSTTCEQCEGEGRVAVDFGIDARGHPRIDLCPSCDGSGTVPGGPVMLDLVAEPAGWQEQGIRLGDGPWSDRVPVYRARESFEEKP